MCIYRVISLSCLQIAMEIYRRVLSFLLKIFKKTHFSKYEKRNHRKRHIILRIVIITEMCNCAKFNQITSLMFGAFWHSSQFRSADSHSAGSSAQLTCFVIMRQINCTSAQEQNSTIGILKGGKGGRNSCRELTHKKQKNCASSHLV
jgi:hypothetical protein